MALVEEYVRFLKSWSRAVIVGVLALTALIFPFAARLSSTATDNFSAAPGTRSKAESDAILGDFQPLFNTKETVYIQCLAGDCECDVRAGVCPGFKGVLDGLAGGLQEYIDDGTVVAIKSLFTYGGKLDMVGKTFYNASASTTFAVLEFDASASENRVKKAAAQALRTANSLSEDGRFKVYIFGKTSTRLLVGKEVGKIMGMADGIAVIFIGLLFGWQVQSWRLTLIPLVNTLLCLVLTNGLIYPLSASGAITLPSHVPSVCLFLCIALSVDYSFFHLSRFQEVRQAGKGFDDSVGEMVTTAGRVVLVSGVVLLFTWLALAAFPVFGVDSLGYCSAITIFACIAVNLVMNPALLVACPQFYGRAPARQAAAVPGGVAAADGSQPLADAPQQQQSFAAQPNMYGRLGVHLTRAPWVYLAPLLVFAVLLPGSVRLFQADFIVGATGGSTPATDYAKQRVLEDFPSRDSAVPLTVMLSPPPGVKVQGQAYFDAGCRLAQLVREETGIAAEAFRGVMLKPENGNLNCISWATAWGLLKVKLPIYGFAWKSAVNPTNTSSVLKVTPPFDIFSDRAKDLVHQGRRAVDAFLALDGFQGWTAVAFHPMAIEVDAEELVVGRLPWTVGGTLLVVFSVIGLRYRAAFMPLKLFMTIALPILSVLGAGVFVFQDGLLDWVGVSSLRSQGGLVWINPVACTFMLIGFALDYDIFLFSRIYADRKSGAFLEDRDAIVHALSATGPVITTAGIIMALAFCGMVAPHGNAFLNQMGFTMILGILVDTFLVRTLLVPAFLSMAGPLNWWPGEMPTKVNWALELSSKKGGDAA